MKMSAFAIYLVCSIGFVAAAPALAQSTSSGAMTSNGSSTGVGNAGSFGIGSGTSDSISTATAVSNGLQDSSTDNSVDSGMHITTVSMQELQATNSDNQITIVGGANPSSTTSSSGSNVVEGSSFSNFSGILANGWNTGPAATAQAGTNIAVNGNFGRN